MFAQADQYVVGWAGAQCRAGQASQRVSRRTAPESRCDRTQTNGTGIVTWQENPLRDTRMYRNNLFNEKKNCSFKSLFDDRQFANRTTAAILGGHGPRSRPLASFVGSNAGREQRTNAWSSKWSLE
ncbi:TPA: hypothetical protein QDC20_000365 [Burkholderia aenigmatica]|uniref:hypothetical protein n=1 Tax=Burkholderia sp. AU45251 TaxID=3059204 RepID=UPI00264E5DEA|nr:hypothetical protein [Burkholderia sp. AU45251]HDR9483265.1 hypothetical protein [Burkholderia aenigmatica]MDN7516130.1 hypothetical protein [Burkholderia sp. AU45251]HDR9514213.1 hypothetical protein [Burkholderia aenigmatica]HDR9591603.1 hypothetical protein [Burkholderia aenigmatica]HDR9598695.1 hypothetical protein [Burkholderia aenigmatica]